MKKNILFKLLFAFLLLPGICFAQPPKKYFNFNEAPYETPDDPYLPNAYNNQKLSPQYRFDSHSRLGNTEIFTRQANVNAGQLNIIGDAANEPTIAVNPLNEQEIVLGWRQFNNVVSNFRQAGYAYSNDGGQTWTFPGSILPGVFASDPVLEYDNAGNVYYNSLMSTPQSLPCFVFKSANGGSSWNNGVYIGGGDKQWMAIDRSGGIGEGNIYSAWTAAFSDCPPGNFTRSSDGATNFDTCSLIIEDLSWGTETVGNNGELYIVGRSPTTVAAKVAKSIDAQDPSLAPSWSVSTVNLGGYITGMTSINPVGLTGQIYIDVDRSFGPGRDNVYVLGSVQPYFNSDPADVMFNKSTDGGLTWNNSAPVRINDDIDTTNTQWFGTMSVAPNGRIDVIWLDTRDNPGSDSSALYYSYSIDEGTTWSANEKLSDSFDPHIGYPNQPKLGDYFDMVSTNSGAHLAWANTLSGGQDVYYSFISPLEVTAVEDVTDITDISVYPNPTNGMIEVSWAGRSVIAEIFTSLGTKIYTTTGFETKHVIDISSQPAGIYLLKLITADHREVVRKIIME